jgi:hypothetical protein
MRLVYQNEAANTSAGSREMAQPCSGVTLVTGGPLQFRFGIIGLEELRKISAKIEGYAGGACTPRIHNRILQILTGESTAPGPV